jgi:hypothetical protein
MSKKSAVPVQEKKEESSTLVIPLIRGRRHTAPPSIKFQDKTKYNRKKVRDGEENY